MLKSVSTCEIAVVSFVGESLAMASEIKKMCKIAPPATSFMWLEWCAGDSMVGV